MSAKLKGLLSDMLVPDEKRDLTSFYNVYWLHQELHKFNGKHPNFPTVAGMLNEIVQNNMFKLRSMKNVKK